MFWKGPWWRQNFFPANFPIFQFKRVTALRTKRKKSQPRNLQYFPVIGVISACSKLYDHLYRTLAQAVLMACVGAESLKWVPHGASLEIWVNNHRRRWNYDAIYAKVMTTNLLPPVNAMDLLVMTTAQELVSALKAHYHYHHKTI